MRRVAIAVLSLMAALWCCGMRGQRLPAGIDPGPLMMLGHAVTAMDGPWKFQIGDSPVGSASAGWRWADPGFDDTAWETVDLASSVGLGKRGSVVGGSVPGWTARGHAGYWGYAWYRMHVRLAPDSTANLAIAGPESVEDAYQVFVDGTLVGSFGRFSARSPTVYSNQPTMFTLPEATGRAERVIALRVWMGPRPMQSHGAGGLRDAPLLGETAAVTAIYRVRWMDLLRTTSRLPVEAFLFALLAVVAFSLMLYDRTDRVYLWMGAVFVLNTGSFLLAMMKGWTQWVNVLIPDMLLADLLIPLAASGWVMVWWVWFRLERPKWIPRMIAVLAGLFVLSNTLGRDEFFRVVPQAVASASQSVTFGIRLALLALTLGIVGLGIRKDGRDGWVVLPALVLAGLGQFERELSGALQVRTVWHPYGVTVPLSLIANVLRMAVVFWLLLRRLLQSVRVQRLLAQDVKEAQEVQRVILPERTISYPGLTIESEFRPAREVGGDFFQILPHETDGSLLIVAGDVAGKGLQAGMLVALLVGAIRTVAQYDPEPVSVLHALNLRLYGRAQATCLALRIGADGEVRLANAGHLPPYRNGEPLAMEGALPLGVLEMGEFAVMRFTMAVGDRLMLMSDGIAEATNGKAQLFGFERVHDLLQTHPTAAEVANAAQQFGQEDDISVISVTRNHHGEAVLV